MYKPNTVIAVVLVALSSAILSAQEHAGTGLPALIKGNEIFGAKLLQQEHSKSPVTNIVLSPLSLTVTFVAANTYAWSPEFGEEMRHVFGWEPQHLELPMKQLLAGFDAPKAAPCRFSTEAKALSKRTGTKLTCPKGIPDSAWITNTLLYRSKPSVEDVIPAYVREGMKKDFAFSFVNTGNRKPNAQDLPKRNRVLTEVPRDFQSPSAQQTNDVWINSAVHLKTKWRGNTFSMSTPRRGEFVTAFGLSRKVTLVDSELELYYYAKTNRFEAATLPGDLAYMLIVMPAPGASIEQLERELIEHPEQLDTALERRVGIVTLPCFHINYEADLSDSIKALGLTQPFKKLDGMIYIKDSHLTRVSQRVDIQVDKEGIRANSETVAGIVYGGILSAQEPFHMVVDRSFLFLIRDQTTNALLFVGALMDPGEEPLETKKR
jgi:serine protease inhibitor